MAASSPTRRAKVKAPDVDSVVDAGFVFDTDAPVSTDEQARVPLFTVGGKTYTMPAETSAAEAIRLLRDIRRHGNALAAEMLLTRFVGDEGVDALLSSKGFDADRWNKVTGAASAHVFGSLEQDPKAAA